MDERVTASLLCHAMQEALQLARTFRAGLAPSSKRATTEGLEEGANPALLFIKALQQATQHPLKTLIQHGFFAN